MAIFFQNTLVRTSDFVKISPRYSSVQSLWRAKKNGKVTVVTIGGLHYSPLPSEAVSMLYYLPNWHGLNIIGYEHIPPTVATLNHISKKIGVGEAVIIQWGIFNRLNVYWVGGTFFANPDEVAKIAASGPK